MRVMLYGQEIEPNVYQANFSHTKACMSGERLVIHGFLNVIVMYKI